FVMGLHLEFEGGYYPYSYANEDGNVSGAFVEMWKIVAELAKTELTIAKSEGRVSTMQNIFANQTFALLDSMSLNVERHRMFLTSVPFGYYEANFYESTRSADSETTELYFFSVFRWSTLLLLVAAYVVTSICSYLLSRNSRRPGISVVHQFVERVITAIFLISLTLVVFHHAAGFQGNTFIVKKGKETTFEELRSEFEGGKRTAIEQVKDQFPPEQVALFTARKKDAIVHEPDYRRILEMLCTNSANTALLYTNQILEIGQIDHPCELSTVKVSSEVMKEIAQFNNSAYTLGTSTPGYFLYSKQSNRRMIRLVNRVVLRLFQQENVS
ncbi:hypothetical protein PFISCL1PPCAC_23849, partial [Pristionchus fissidentatus]